MEQRLDPVYYIERVCYCCVRGVLKVCVIPHGCSNSSEGLFSNLSLISSNWPPTGVTKSQKVLSG